MLNNLGRIVLLFVLTISNCKALYAYNTDRLDLVSAFMATCSAAGGDLSSLNFRAALHGFNKTPQNKQHIPLLHGEGHVWVLSLPNDSLVLVFKEKSPANLATCEMITRSQSPQNVNLSLDGRLKNQSQFNMTKDLKLKLIPNGELWSVKFSLGEKPIEYWFLHIDLRENPEFTARLSIKYE